MSSHIDPVCHMDVESDSEIRAQVNGKEYFFCSSHCRDAFVAHPESYLLEKRPENREVHQSALKTYFPLILIFAYLLGIVAVIEFQSGAFDSERMMNHFMGGFFLFFSFFKFLDLSGFAEAYRTYDLVAKRFPLYGWIYPFLELALGLAYVSHLSIRITHLVTLVVMLVSSIGVIQSLLKNSRFQCACLGTLFKFPMTKVTLFEDLLMAGMAAVGLIWPS